MFFKKKTFWPFFVHLTCSLLLFGFTLAGCKGIENDSNKFPEYPELSDQPTIPTQFTQTQDQAIQVEPEVIDPIRLVWFYKPPKDNNLAYLAENYDLFILTKLDERIRDELINSFGVDSPILRYIRFDAIMDPGSCLEQPYRNQVADVIGDFCWISNQHPDWFLLNKEGRRITNEEGNYYFMDPGNQEWRIFWLERIEKNQQQLGWEGIFLDNVEAGFAKRERTGNMPLQYETAEEYQSAIKGFLEYIYNNFAVPTNRLVYANVLSDDLLTGLLSYLPYLDGVMIEGFAVDWNNGYRNPKEWSRQLEIAEIIEKENIHVIMVAKGDNAEPARQQFAFASYLLVTNGSTFFRFVLNDRTNEIVNFENYNFDLGQPLGERYLESDTWIRVFEKGIVRVNPVTEEAVILIK